MAWASGYTILPPLTPGAETNAYGVSDDGSVVVGYASDGTTLHAVYWTQAGIVDLGFLPGGTFSVAYAVSADGTVIVGQSDATDGFNHGFRWTGSGMVNLGAMVPSGSTDGYGVSGDGLVVVGDAQDPLPNFRPAQWASGPDWTILGSLPGSTNPTGQCNNASLDGSVIVGDAIDVDGNDQAFYWTQGTGMVGLGFLPGGSTSSAISVSDDGSVMVGATDATDTKYHAMRWTQSGMDDIGLPSGSTQAFATSISNDGTKIIGVGTDDSMQSPQLFLWTADGITILPNPPGTDPAWQYFFPTWFQAYRPCIRDGSVIVGAAPIVPEGGGSVIPSAFVYSFATSAVTWPRAVILY